MTMENPVYVDKCGRNPQVPSLPMRPENEYVVNVYSNPMPTVQRLLAKKAAAEAESSTTSENDTNTHEENPNMVGPEDDGYEQPVPRSPDYLPMDGVIPWEEPANTEVVIRKRPLSDEYILPQNRESNIYADIPEDSDEEIPHHNIYETIDEVTEEISRRLGK